MRLEGGCESIGFPIPFWNTGADPEILAHANAPAINAAFWVGGFQSSDTTPAITNATLEFATGTLRFNTSTQSVDSLPAPFTPVQNGALNFLNIGGGLLVYIGGETPEKQDGINMTFTVVSKNWWGPTAKIRSRLMALVE